MIPWAHRAARSVIRRYPAQGRGICRPIVAVVILSVVAVACGTGETGRHGSETADCAINEGACMGTLFEGAVAVFFEIDPRPVSAMAPLVFGVTLQEGEQGVDAARVLLSLTMPAMVMGANKPVMTDEGSGRYSGEGVIPRCPSGKRLWQAEVTVTWSGQTESTRFRFEVD